MAYPLETHQDLKQRLELYVESPQQQGGVLLLTDLCGSTPANICLEIAKEHAHCELVTGLSLAMLIKLATCDRHQEPRVLAEALSLTGKKSILLGSELQRNEARCGD
jgi:mannose/fructose-specific phosphotransferase system component IIA